MGKEDKDRHQKELAVRYCLAEGALPFLEVCVPSQSDLSDSTEVLTDLDVLGVEGIGDGGLRRSLYDCKTAKMSPINRAFWAAGVRDYTGCDVAFVILKKPAVHNHRISALSIGVDLHDEQSFRELGETLDPSFPDSRCYQADLERWHRLNDSYARNSFSAELFNHARNLAPITRTPWVVFRQLISELRAVRGELDPAKPDHLAILLDVVCSGLVLWTTMCRDMRRLYSPGSGKAAFEKLLRYYLWGGRSSYELRSQLRETRAKATGELRPMELPAWNKLVTFAGLLLSGPGSILECAHVCREMSLRVVSGPDADLDKELARRISNNNRVRQYSISLSNYFVEAVNLPKDFTADVEGLFAAECPGS
jgi:hypothetical protein